MNELTVLMVYALDGGTPRFNIKITVAAYRQAAGVPALLFAVRHYRRYDIPGTKALYATGLFCTGALKTMLVNAAHLATAMTGCANK